MSIDGWKDKQNLVCAHNGILFSLKKEGNPAICDNMVGHGGHNAKRNKSKKDSISLTYVWFHLMWNLNSQTHRSTK